MEKSHKVLLPENSIGQKLTKVVCAKGTVLIYWKKGIAMAWETVKNISKEK